ncbi:DUF421 domain-containing protein [Bacillus sp. Marseille-P3661]|uniref:DUF421 domain-containing protein n=1 Tax=Bacillus sp. Marseille-P3661 TaxID=1936234 RepID=UPI000C84052B|nr:DUF421 domain-containing protein [Bacillus sp. Marseille-P3661]
MVISELLIRIFLSFTTLFILTRIMGRKEISQMTFFNFVSAIAIGSIAANLVVSSTLSIRNGIIALVGWTVFTLVMAFIDIKFKEARKITTGEPIIVIKEGKIMEDALRKTQLDMDSLNTLLRQKDVFSIKDVNYAIFETSGQLSVMKYENKQPATKGDLNIPNKVKAYPTATQVISDGVINTTNLSRLNLDENWVNQQLQKEGISQVSEVFYAEVQQDGTLYIDRKDDNMLH